MVVSDCRVVVSGLCIDVINLDESGAWRRGGEVTSLKGLTREQPVTIPELVVDLHVELMIIIGLGCIRVEVVTGARLIACRRPYRRARDHFCRNRIKTGNWNLPSGTLRGSDRWKWIPCQRIIDRIWKLAF